jgi:hypothetical protein
MTSKSVKKKSSNELSLSSDMLEQDAGLGNQNMGQEDLALPFLKIISGLDSILDEDETARKGDIVNTVTGKIYKGKNGVRVIPCSYQRRFIQWAPRGQGSGAPLAIYGPNDARPKTERSPEDNKEYVVGGEGDYIEETHQHYVILLNADGLAETALIAMKSTQLKKSRKWNSMIASITLKGKDGPFQPARFSHIYTLKTVSEENSKGSWHGWEMSKEGIIEDATLYSQAKSFAESISKGDVVVKHDDGSTSEETKDVF